jgi:hypothetical protein
MDVLHRHLLLAFAAVAVEGVQQRGIGARKLVRLREILAPSLEGLFAKHCAAVAFHRSVVRSDELRGDHPLNLIFRAYPDESGNRSTALTVEGLFIRMGGPKRSNRLTRNSLVPVIRLRSADGF